MKSFVEFFLEYRHNLADGTPSQSIQVNNGKDPNRVGPNKKHLGYVPEYQAVNPKAHTPGAIFAGQELAKLMADYNFTKYDAGTIHKIKNSPFALEMYTDNRNQPAGRIIKTK